MPERALRKVPPPQDRGPGATRGPERVGNGAETTPPAPHGMMGDKPLTSVRERLKRPSPPEQVQRTGMSILRPVGGTLSQMPPASHSARNGRGTEGGLLPSPGPLIFFYC